MFDFDFSQFEAQGADPEISYDRYSGGDYSNYDFSGMSGGEEGYGGGGYSYEPSYDYSQFEAQGQDPQINYDDFGQYRGYDFSSQGQDPEITYAQQSPSFLDQLISYAAQGERFAGSPLGKMAIGLGGAGMGLYGQKKAQKEYNKRYKQAKAMQDARRAEAMKYDSPLRLASQRQAVEAPVARRGESAFFSNNQLPSYFAEGGRANEDDPSAMGFIKYMIARRKLPSEIRQEAEGQAYRTGVPNRHITRQQILDRQEREAMGEQPVEQPQYARGGYVGGGSSGQADKIPAMLSDGEYVFDADVVSALGDGNNAAGAKALDKMRQSVRTHKRKAPSASIPPKAKSPLEYMKKGAK